MSLVIIALIVIVFLVFSIIKIVKKIPKVIRKKIGVILFVAVFLLFGITAHYLLTHTEENVKKAFTVNKDTYEELVKIVLTKEPYMSAYLSDSNGIEIEYVNGRLIQSRWTENEKKIVDAEFEAILKQLIKKCYVSSIHIFKKEIIFECNLPQVSISFIYAPKEERKELNRLQTEIDDNWYTNWFRGF